VTPVLQTLHRALRRFSGDEAGGLSVETVLIFPLLAWAYAATFTFFDAFRMQAANTKATYTISDMLTRVTEEIDQEYLNGLLEVYEYIVKTRHPDMFLRVTTVGWDPDAEEYFVVWSRGANTVKRHTDATINSISEYIPDIAAGDTLIMVETALPFRPVFNVGLDELVFRNITPSSPRFTPQLLWEGMGDGTGVPHDDGTGVDLVLVDGPDESDYGDGDDD
jgi:Flp pilus assembly protein TadG